MDQSYISKLEANKVGWSPEGLESISRVLGVTSGTLLDGVFETGDAKPARQPGMIPIYDFIQAGSPREVSGTFRDEDIESYVYSDLSHPRELFALIIRGSSMEPQFMEGDLVLFRRGLEPHPGDFVAASSLSVGGTFKRFRDLGITPDGQHQFALVPLNENYPSFRSEDAPWTIEGTLVRHIRDYRR